MTIFKLYRDFFKKYAYLIFQNKQTELIYIYWKMQQYFIFWGSGLGQNETKVSDNLEKYAYNMYHQTSIILLIKTQT